MLLEPLYQHFANKPQSTAIIDDRGSTTYGELMLKSLGLSRVLQSVSASNAVGVVLPSSAAFAACFYGSLLSGKSIVPINFLLSPQQIAHIVRDSGIDTILSAPPLAEKFAAAAQQLGVKLVDLSTLPQQSPPAPGSFQLPPPPKVDLDSPAILLYTSGTSGNPKGVRLTHRNLGTCIDGCIQHAKLKGEHKFLGLVPLFHSLGLTGTLLAPMLLGTTVVYQARFSPVGAIEKLREHKLSIAIAIPSMYKALLSLKSATKEDFAHTYALICGGEPLPPTVFAAFKEKFGVELCEGYGLSETCGATFVNVPGDRRTGSVGRPIPGATVRIVNESKQSEPQGHIGEILLGGPMIMQGYHNLPDATREVLDENHEFRTGDLGRLDEDGYLYITGRAKDMIIIAGEKLFPREIEELLMQHASIADAAVIGKKDESRGEVVVAFVVPKEGQTITPDAVKQHLKDLELPNWKLPRDVVVIDDLPRSPTGKVLKRELAARAG